jgi:hypothetical protein
MPRFRSSSRLWLLAASLALIPSIATAQNAFIALHLTFNGHVYDGYNSHAIYASLLFKPTVDGDPWIERDGYVAGWTRGSDHGLLEVNGNGEFQVKAIGTADGVTACALLGGGSSIGTLVLGDTVAVTVNLDWNYCAAGVAATATGAAKGEIHISGADADHSFVATVDSDGVDYSDVGAHAGEIAHGQPVTYTIIPSPGSVAQAAGRRGGVGESLVIDTVANKAIALPVNFFVPPSFSITLGGNSPTGVDTVARGSTRVPMIEFSLNPSTPQTINSVTVRGHGTGDESVDVTAVKLYHDLNGNGRVDSGEPTLSSGTFPANDGTVTLNVAPPYNVSGPTSLLVTYDYSTHIAARLGGAMTLAFLPLICFPGVRRRKRVAMVLMALVAGIAVASCGGGDVDGSTGPPPSGESSNYQVTVSDVDVSGTMHSNLGLSGATVTVLK